MTKESDRYFTSQEILDLVLAQWGSIDLDPCWDPESIVQATTRYDIRQGQDGLLLPWHHNKIWLNPPYSDPAPWIHRAALHAQAGGEVLALVVAAVGSSYWRRLVWPFASVCALSPRPKFSRPASLGPKRSATQIDHAVLYYGPDHAGFGRTWAARGELITSHRLVRT